MTPVSKPLRENERESLLARIWEKTHKDYKSMWNGQRSILVMRQQGTTIVPLTEMTDEEIRRHAR